MNKSLEEYYFKGTLHTTIFNMLNTGNISEESANVLELAKFLAFNERFLIKSKDKEALFNYQYDYSKNKEESKSIIEFYDKIMLLKQLRPSYKCEVKYEVIGFIGAEELYPEEQRKLTMALLLIQKIREDITYGKFVVNKIKDYIYVKFLDEEEFNLDIPMKYFSNLTEAKFSKDMPVNLVNFLNKDLINTTGMNIRDKDNQDYIYASYYLYADFISSIMIENDEWQRYFNLSNVAFKYVASDKDTSVLDAYKRYLSVKREDKLEYIYSLNELKVELTKTYRDAIESINVGYDNGTYTLYDGKEDHSKAVLTFEQAGSLYNFTREIDKAMDLYLRINHARETIEEIFDTLDEYLDKLVELLKIDDEEEKDRIKRIEVLYTPLLKLKEFVPSLTSLEYPTLIEGDSINENTVIESIFLDSNIDILKDSYMDISYDELHPILINIIENNINEYDNLDELMNKLKENTCTSKYSLSKMINNIDSNSNLSIVSLFSEASGGIATTIYNMCAEIEGFIRDNSDTDIKEELENILYINDIYKMEIVKLLMNYVRC